MTKKLLISAVVLSAVPVLGLNAQDSASYQKNYSSYLAEWERDLNRRSGIAVPERQTVSDETASSDSPWAPPRHKRMEQQRGASSPFGNAVSVEAFYAMATEKLFSGELPGDSSDWKIDLSGVTLQYSFWKSEGDGWREFSSTSPKVELFTSASLAYGEENPGGEIDVWNDVTGNWEYESSFKDEYQIWLGQVSVGGNLVWEVNPMWDVFVGARIGLSCIAVKNEWDGEYDSGSSSETGVGCIYGVRLGTNIHFSENHALTLAADYWGTTARAEFETEYDDGSSESEKSKNQSYCVFSVGYKYSF